MQIEPTGQGNRRLRSSYISSILSISLVLLMLGLLGLLLLDAKKISDYVKEHAEVNIFLNADTDQEDVEKLKRHIEKQAYTKSVIYTSKEQALDSMLKELGDEALGMIESNPLPASLDIRIKSAYANEDSIKAIELALKSNSIVDDVSSRKTEVEKMNSNFRKVALVILSFCAVMFFIALALINNTIRLSMYSKRFLIKSMQLVGATRAFIRWPFLMKGIAHGIYAGIIASIFLCGIIYLIHSRFPELGQLSDMNMLYLLIGAVLALGLVLSFVSTYFAVNKFLRLKSEDLY